MIEKFIFIGFAAYMVGLAVYTKRKIDEEKNDVNNG